MEENLEEDIIFKIGSKLAVLFIFVSNELLIIRPNN